MRILFSMPFLIPAALILFLSSVARADSQDQSEPSNLYEDIVRIGEGQIIGTFGSLVLGSGAPNPLDHNAVHIHQNGFSNFFVVRQEGSGNLLLSVQEGIGNTGSAAQIGNQNKALIKQKGIGNSANGITQLGNGHVAIVKQFGHGNVAPRITQTPGAPPVVVTQR